MSGLARAMFEKTDWFPEKYLISDNIPDQDFALVILNRPLKLDPYYFIQLWNKAFYRVTVDGGTDIWLNFKRTYCKSIPLKNIDMICGDFDSISSEAMAIVRHIRDSSVVHTPDQDETDFSKSLRELEPHIKSTKVRTVVVVSQTSGRLDQIMANINTLHRSKQLTSANRILLLSDNSISFLLDPGKHTINIPPPLVAKQDWCAIMPFRAATRVRTTGLKWNLKDQVLQFGGIVSTSNTYEPNAKKVEIKTDQPVLWSMGITQL